MLALGRLAQLGTCRESHSAVRRHGDESPSLATSDGPDPSGLNLPHLKGAEAGQHDPVASGQRRLDALQDGI